MYKIQKTQSYTWEHLEEKNLILNPNIQNKETKNFSLPG